MKPTTAIRTLFALLLLALAFPAPAQVTTSSARLTLQMSERWRPRAETCLGLIAIAPEVYRRLAAVECTGEGVIDDGTVGQGEFTKAHYRALTALWGTVASLGQSTATLAALQALQVRSIGVIMPRIAWPEAGPDTLESNLGVLRQLMPGVRALRRLIEDDSRVTPRAVAGLAASTVIDDGRGLRAVTAGDILLIHSTLAALTGPETNSDAVADATDSVCCSPLRCE